jgi:preprotein translocase subunit YajC
MFDEVGQVLLAQAAPREAFPMFLPFLIIIMVVWVFLVILPQRRERKKRDEMLANIKKGDSIITMGGIHGIITNVKDDTVMVKVDDNVKLEFSRGAISQVTKKSQE